MAMNPRSSEAARSATSKDTEIVLGVLRAAEEGRLRSQRQLATDLGIALGLANTYVKRCVRKGLMKVSEVPARRYAYYLTPKGFAEKSRLTAEYLSSSLSFFRLVRSDCRAILDVAISRGWTRVALVGLSEITEIAALCAIDSGITVAAVIEPNDARRHIAGVPVISSIAELSAAVDGVIVCAIQDTSERFAEVEGDFGPTRILVPGLLLSRLKETAHE